MTKEKREELFEIIEKEEDGLSIGYVGGGLFAIDFTPACERKPPLKCKMNG